MNIDRNLARELCRELGIEWDQNLSVPTLQGIPVTHDSLEDLFPASIALSFSSHFSSLHISNFSNYSDVDLKCA